MADLFVTQMSTGEHRDDADGTHNIVYCKSPSVHVKFIFMAFLSDALCRVHCAGLQRPSQQNTDQVSSPLLILSQNSENSEAAANPQDVHWPVWSP